MSNNPNKELALEFLRLVVSGEILKAYEKYVAADFCHHNAYFAGDRASLLKAMEEAHRQNPAKQFQIKQAIAEGDLVVIHSYLKLSREDLGQEDLGMAVVHIFRFEGGKIRELWDLGQKILLDSPNKNGMF